MCSLSFFRIPFVPTLALLALLAVPISANIGAAETPVMNTHCPVTGKPIDPNAKTVMMTIGEGTEAKSYKMGFCSNECCVEFMKDPAKFLGPKVGDMRKGAPLGK